MAVINFPHDLGGGSSQLPSTTSMFGHIPSPQPNIDKIGSDLASRVTSFFHGVKPGMNFGHSQFGSMMDHINPHDLHLYHLLRLTNFLRR